MPQLVGLRFEEWPNADRELWGLSIDELNDTSVLAAMRRSTQRQARLGYGQWLAWVARCCPADIEVSPTSRMTEANVVAFVRYLRGRPVHLRTISNYLQAILAVGRSFHPETDFQHVRKILARVARRGKRAPYPTTFIVHASQLVDLGLREIETACSGDFLNIATADQFIDGLLVALWISLPLRISDFSKLRLGEHLRRTDGTWHTVACSTKTSRADIGGLPDFLTKWLDLYADTIRPMLVARNSNRADDGCLWVDIDGRPLSAGMLRKRVKALTLAEFGKALVPHSMRKIAVTTFGNERPDLAVFQPALLGHTSGRTTEKYYVQAQARMARTRYHRLIDQVPRTGSGR